MNSCPLYLKEYEDLWKKNKKEANLKWFSEAGYGLFLHYGLYSLFHGLAWDMYYKKIPLEKYEKLLGHFTAHNFNADVIVDLAVQAGMKYITMTACHHEGFCLWDSKVEDYNSMNTPANRDLVREMSEACDRKGIGFFVYYTFMANWHYPYFISHNKFDFARPDYDPPEKRYRDSEADSFTKYIEYVERCIDELLSKYKVTGIWFDIIIGWYVLGEEYIPIEKIYEKIRRKYPDVLISWKQGATGTEDFASPEQYFRDLSENIRKGYGEEAGLRAKAGFIGNKDKHNEICATIQNGCWAYNPFYENRSVEDLYSLLGHANAHNCNLLLNVGPMSDGSIHPEHRKILLDLSEKIKREGIPEKDSKVGEMVMGAGAE